MSKRTCKNRTWIRIIAMAICLTLVLNSVSFAQEAKNLSPYSRFNPAVHIDEDRGGQLSIKEEAAATSGMIAGFKEDAAFVYLSLLIAQVLEMKGGDKISAEGLKDLVKRDLAHIDLTGFDIDALRKEDKEFLLPYRHKDNGRRMWLRYFIPEEGDPAGTEMSMPVGIGIVRMSVEEEVYRTPARTLERTLAERKESAFEKMKARFLSKGFEINEILYIMPQHITGLGQSSMVAMKYARKAGFDKRMITIPKEYMARGQEAFECTQAQAIDTIIDELAKNTDHIYPGEDLAFIGVKLDEGSGYLEIAYYDNGTGNPEAKKRFGQRYTTTNMPDRGYGLRLIKYIVENIGGTVTFHTGPKMGTYIMIGIKLPPIEKSLKERLKVFRDNPLIKALEQKTETEPGIQTNEPRYILKIEDWLPGLVAVDVYPTGKDRNTFDALKVLDQEADEAEIPPAGSFGRIKADIIEVAGEPALLISEVHPSRGGRQLEKKSFHDRAVSNRYAHWREQVVRHIMQAAGELGIKKFYAVTPQRQARKWPPTLMGTGNRHVNYQKPFRDRWKKEKVAFKMYPNEKEEEEEDILWRYIPAEVRLRSWVSRALSEFLKFEKLLNRFASAKEVSTKEDMIPRLKAQAELLGTLPDELVDIGLKMEEVGAIIHGIRNSVTRILYVDILLAAEDFDIKELYGSVTDVKFMLEILDDTRKIALGSHMAQWYGGKERELVWIDVQASLEDERKDPPEEVTPRKALAKIRKHLLLKRKKLDEKGLRRSLIAVIDGDSCVGKTELCSQVKAEDVYVVNLDRYTDQEEKDIERTEDGKPADSAWEAWAKTVSGDIKAAVLSRKYRLIVIEGFEVFKLVRFLQNDHWIPIDLKLHLTASEDMRLKNIMAKSAMARKGQEDYFKGFLANNVQKYERTPSYDLVIKNDRTIDLIEKSRMDLFSRAIQRDPERKDLFDRPFPGKGWELRGFRKLLFFGAIGVMALIITKGFSLSGAEGMALAMTVPFFPIGRKMTIEEVREYIDKLYYEDNEYRRIDALYHLREIARHPEKIEDTSVLIEILKEAERIFAIDLNEAVQEYALSLIALLAPRYRLNEYTEEKIIGMLLDDETSTILKREALKVLSRDRNLPPTSVFQASRAIVRQLYSAIENDMSVQILAVKALGDIVRFPQGDNEEIFKDILRVLERVAEMGVVPFYEYGDDGYMREGEMPVSDEVRQQAMKVIVEIFLKEILFLRQSIYEGRRITLNMIMSAKQNFENRYDLFRQLVLLSEDVEERRIAAEALRSIATEWSTFIADQSVLGHRSRRVRQYFSAMKLFIVRKLQGLVYNNGNRSLEPDKGVKLILSDILVQFGIPGYAEPGRIGEALMTMIFDGDPEIYQRAEEIMLEMDRRAGGLAKDPKLNRLINISRKDLSFRDIAVQAGRIIPLILMALGTGFSVGGIIAGYSGLAEMSVTGSVVMAGILGVFWLESDNREESLEKAKRSWDKLKSQVINRREATSVMGIARGSTVLLQMVTVRDFEDIDSVDYTEVARLMGRILEDSMTAEDMTPVKILVGSDKEISVIEGEEKLEAFRRLGIDFLPAQVIYRDVRHATELHFITFKPEKIKRQSLLEKEPVVVDFSEEAARRAGKEMLRQEILNIGKVYGFTDFVEKGREKWGIYAPTPVETALKILFYIKSVSPDAKICDIGSGKGQFCTLAAAAPSLKFPEVTGIEGRESLNLWAKENLSHLGHLDGTENVSFINRDFMTEDLSKYDVLYFFYTFPDGKTSRDFDQKLRAKMVSKTGLKPGAKLMILGEHDPIADDEELSRRVVKLGRTDRLVEYTREPGEEQSTDHGPQTKDGREQGAGRENEKVEGRRKKVEIEEDLYAQDSRRATQDDAQRQAPSAKLTRAQSLEPDGGAVPRMGKKVEGSELEEETEDRTPVAEQVEKGSQKAQTLVDTVIRIRQRNGEKEKIMIGIDTDWMPSMRDIQALVSEIKRLTGLDDIIVVRERGAELAIQLEKAAKKKGVSYANIVVLGPESILRDEAFRGLKSTSTEMKALLVGIDGRNLSDENYIMLVEILDIALKMAFEGDKLSSLAGVVVENKGPRQWLFIPEAKQEDFNEWKKVYDAQRDLIAAA